MQPRFRLPPPAVSPPNPAAPRPPESPVPFSSREFRDALAAFATGITVICTREADGRSVGFTANSFNSVSLDPPLVLWSLALTGSHLAAFRATPVYAVNVLATDQVAIAQRFSQPHTDRFEGIAHRLSPGGAPLLDGCTAWFECAHYAQHHVGDHVLFIGRVLDCARQPGAGLAYHHGQYAATRPL